MSDWIIIPISTRWLRSFIIISYYIYIVKYQLIFFYFIDYFNFHTDKHTFFMFKYQLFIYYTAPINFIDLISLYDYGGYIYLMHGTNRTSLSDPMRTSVSKLFIDTWHRRINVIHRAKLIYDAASVINKELRHRYSAQFSSIDYVIVLSWKREGESESKERYATFRLSISRWSDNDRFYAVVY